MSNQVERDPIVFKEAILEQKDVKARVSFAEPAEWKPKDAVRQAEGGDSLKDRYKAVKISVIMTDDSIRTEHADAVAKVIVDDQFNAERYPYLDKKTEKVAWLNR